VPVTVAAREVLITLVEVRYLDGDAEIYVLPIGFAESERARTLTASAPDSILISIRNRGVLYEAIADEDFVNVLVDGVGRRRRWRGKGGELVGSRTRSFGDLRGPDDPLRATVLRGEQSNTSINLGDRLLFKLFRKLEPGINPDLEIGRHLTERTEFRRVPLLAGGLEFRGRHGEPMTVAVLHQFVPSEGDAWSYTLNALSQYFERALVSRTQPGEAELGPASLFDRAHADLPPLVEESAGPYLENARLLGQRTAELHLSLADAGEDPALAPEPFTALYRRSLYQSLRSLARTTFELLRRQMSSLPEEAREQARAVLGLEEQLLRRVRAMLDRKVRASRIRIHGDYHLGQVLFTGKDFVIVDFEGEPSRSLSERRFKRSTLRDVAGMIRSFEYASAYAIHQGPGRVEDIPTLKPWGRIWHRWASAMFLRGYLNTAGDAPFLARSRDDASALLDFYLLDKAVYELRYELNNRPEWVGIPLTGILALMESEPAPRSVVAVR
jgi:maltose alpha-D-glucosyltransferase/alpha-amylase